jgi:alanine racemase
MARPVLNTPQQVARWREWGGGRECDVMIDSGINRLGLSAAEAAGGLLDGLQDPYADEPSRLRRRG